jgi:hypothetical protein
MRKFISASVFGRDVKSKNKNGYCSPIEKAENTHQNCVSAVEKRQIKIVKNPGDSQK